MCWYSCVNGPCTNEQCQITRLEIEEMHRMLERHATAIAEIQSLTRQNHQLLTLLYSRQFGAFPPIYE